MEFTNVRQCLAYLYTVFASLGDGKLEESELEEIALLLKGWTAGEEKDVKQIHKDIQMAREMLSMDIKKPNKVNDQINFCVDSVKHAWNDDKETNLAVVQDLINIGLADGDFDKVEKKWVNTLSNQFGIEMPSVQSAKLAKTIGNEPVDLNDEDKNEDIIASNQNSTVEYYNSVWEYRVLPKHWKEEHVISCLVRFIMTLELPVRDIEMEFLRNDIIHNYNLKGINVDGVWDDVDDEIMVIAQNKFKYPLLIQDSLFYVGQNFNKEKRELLLGFLIKMISQTNVIEYEEFLALRTCIDYWFWGELDERLKRIKNLGINIIKKGILPREDGSDMFYRLIKLEESSVNLKNEKDRAEIKSKNNEEKEIVWGYLDLLAYLYHAFASITDGLLHKKEKREIRILLKDWDDTDPNPDISKVDKAIKQSKVILYEDFNAGNKKVVERINFCLKSLKVIDENWGEDAFKAILTDLVNIAISDNGYSDSEKEFVENVGRYLGVNGTPSTNQAASARPDTTNYIHNDEEEENEVFFSNSANKEENLNNDWNIIHDLGVFYMYFANLSDHPDGDLKQDELDYILGIYPKWAFNFDDVKYGFGNGNPSDLQETWDFIFSKMYNNGDPMPSVNESHKNLIDYMNKGLFTIGNLDTFLQTLYDLCLADNFMTEGQKHQLTYYCEYFKTHSDIANKLLALMNPENALNQLDKIFGDTEFDVDGRPIDKNDEKVSEEKEKSNSRNKYTENYEKIFGKKNSNEEKSEKSSINSELTLQDQLAGELLKLYPNSEVKKINDGNKLDIHLPDVNKRKGTHICFNCAKTGEIKIHFFSRDKLFNEDIIKNGSDILEEISGRIRLIKNPSLRTVKDAIKIADHLIKVLLSSPKTKKEDSEKSKTNKKLTLQDQLADELLKLYPNADVKKINDGNYLDIHMSVIHSRKGTHLWFNTPKAGGIKVGFFCRDEDFKEETLKNHPNLIEAYSNGLRLKGHPIYSDIETALDAAKNFIGYLKTKDTEIEVKKEGEEGKPTGTIEDSQDISTT